VAVEDVVLEDVEDEDVEDEDVEVGDEAVEVEDGVTVAVAVGVASFIFLAFKAAASNAFAPANLSVDVVRSELLSAIAFNSAARSCSAACPDLTRFNLSSALVHFLIVVMRLHPFYP
jgi:hypothetical protein